MTVIASGEAVPRPPRYSACIAHMSQTGSSAPVQTLLRECRQKYEAIQQRALDYLILSDWLIQEASSHDLRTSRAEIERRLQQDKASPEAELHAILGESRQTSADRELEAIAQLASSKLTAMTVKGKSAVSPAQVADYYRSHKSEFLLVERRYFDIDNLSSDAEARKARKEIESGKSFASVSFGEELSHEVDVHPRPGREAIDHAIFSAKLHVLTGPILLSDVKLHSLFELTRIVPASYEPLAEVSGAIATRLAAQQREQALGEFIGAWRARWIGRTDCRPGYVVERCRQYTGSRAKEANTALQ
jgi:foldase protein PrsA